MKIDVHVHLHGDDYEQQTLRSILYSLSLLNKGVSKMADDFTVLEAKVDGLVVAAATNKQTLADVLAALKAVTPTSNQPEIDALVAKVQGAIDGIAADDAAAEAAIAPPPPPAP